MNIWRMHTKPGKHSDSNKVAEYWLDNDIFGTGWQIKEEMTSKLGVLNNIDIEEWFQIMTTMVEPGNLTILEKSYKSLKKINKGDLIVIRKKGIYYAGMVSSDKWQYIDTKEAQLYDTYFCRKVDKFYELGLADAMPGKVVNNFRAPRDCNRIADDTAISVLKMLYNHAIQKNEFDIDKISIDKFLNLLQSEDLEEMVSIYLQVEKNCVLFSSSNKIDTQAYEFVMVQKGTGNKVIAQIKQGEVAVSETFFTPFLESSKQTNTKREIYIYDQLSKDIENNDVIESNEFCSVIRISKVELLSFFESHLYLMPQRIQKMYQYVAIN
ncbi:hypothetical protein ACODJC_12515 [Vagococcus fluvialis]|uniref:hypothetical protein n=1 Tax=Vagococcus fluvialis TaxID=2738 RepID=UPI003B5A29EB